VGYRVLFGLIWIGITLSTFNYLTKGYRLNEDKNVRGISGFTHQFIDQKSLHYIVTLDNKSHGANAIFAFLNNDTGLEIKNSRIITLDQIADYSNVNIEDYEYDGHAGPLYVLLPVSYQGLKANTILKFFPGYKDFIETQLSEKYILYSAK
jgi:hypothetical protein